LFLSPYLKRRIRKKGQQGLSGRPTPKLTLSMNIAPTKGDDYAISEVEDFALTFPRIDGHA
jgi:hypothetical protein